MELPPASAIRPASLLKASPWTRAAPANKQRKAFIVVIARFEGGWQDQECRIGKKREVRCAEREQTTILFSFWLFSE
jgi:hypothetical protein